MSDRKSIFRWEMWGILFIIVLGSSMHFVFNWMGQARPVALFAAVNESTWEHLKLAFWPSLLYFFIEYRHLHRNGNFLTAKTLGIFLMPVIIVLLFYSYTAIIADNFILDIMIFMFAVAIGQITGYRIMSLKQLPVVTRTISIAILIILLLSFSLLTYFAPHFLLFRDPVNGGYGIIP